MEGIKCCCFLLVLFVIHRFLFNAVLTRTAKYWTDAVQRQYYVVINRKTFSFSTYKQICRRKKKMGPKSTKLQRSYCLYTSKKALSRRYIRKRKKTFVINNKNFTQREQPYFQICECYLCNCMYSYLEGGCQSEQFQVRGVRALSVAIVK